MAPGIGLGGNSETSSTMLLFVSAFCMATSWRVNTQKAWHPHQTEQAPRRTDSSPTAGLNSMSMPVKSKNALPFDRIS